MKTEMILINQDDQKLLVFELDEPVVTKVVEQVVVPDEPDEAEETDEEATEEEIVIRETVADKAGILIQHYQKFEGGERNLRTASFDVACRVLEALDLDIVKYFHHEYVLGEERYRDSEGWKYKKTGKLVDEDVE